jgi:hypothetical protein
MRSGAPRYLRRLRLRRLGADAGLVLALLGGFALLALGLGLAAVP